MINLEKREKILFGVFGFVLLIFLFDKGYLGDWSSPGSDNVTVKQNSEAEENQNVLFKYTQVVTASIIPASQNWGKDPFFYVSEDEVVIENEYVDKLFGEKQEKNARGFDLEGISWIGKSGIAIINGNFLKEGDKIKGYVVHKIEIKYVTLKQGTKSVRLTINE